MIQPDQGLDILEIRNGLDAELRGNQSRAEARKSDIRRRTSSVGTVNIVRNVSALGSAALSPHLMQRGAMPAIGGIAPVPVLSDGRGKGTAYAAPNQSCDLHHHLFAAETGETVGGIAALAGLFFVVSGVILWWRTRKTFELRLLPRRLSRPAVLRHHRDLGIIAAPLLLLTLLTGAILVFRPVAALILGPLAPALIDSSLKAPEPRPAAMAGRHNWRAMIETARTRFPEAEIRSLSLPRNGSGLITLRMKKPEEWLPNGRTTLWFAADSGRLIAVRDASLLPATVQVYNMLYPLHAAKIGGLGYRLAMTFAGMALGLLGVLTLWSFWFARKQTQAPHVKIKLQDTHLPRVE